MRGEVMSGDHSMSDLRRAALAMGPWIREQADEIERQRRLTPPVVKAMKQAGIYAMSMPKVWGGLELDLPEQLRVLETLASFDGSVGWCASVGIGCGYASAWLTDQAGRELMPDVNSIFAGSALFAGRALRVDGGYRISGRWPFNSGFLVRKEPLSQGMRARFAPATTNAHRSCTKAVDFLYKASGGASVYARWPLDRCFRDIHTISQHHFTSVAFDEKAGQVMLGLPPADQMF